MNKISTFPYKGYEISPSPYLLSSGEWSVKIYIRQHAEDYVGTRDFSALNSFKTKEEAIQHCVDFGMRIVDGEIENCTLIGL